MDKSQKKALRNQYAADQKKQFIDILPFEVTLFHELFDYLDSYLEEHGCDHTLQATRNFLHNNNLPVESSLDWMAEQGGYCDCEVLANLEDKFEGI